MNRTLPANPISLSAKVPTKNSGNRHDLASYYTMKAKDDPR